MRNLIDLLVTLAVFWVGSEYFSEYVAISDLQTLIIASLFMFVIGYLFNFLLIVSFAAIPLGVGCVTTPLLLLASVVLTPIKLWLLDTYLTGFEINGFWTYVILTIVLSLFSVGKQSQR